MGQHSGPASPGPKTASTLWIDTDPTLHHEFRAACSLLGQTMKDRVNEFMRQTVAEAFSRFNATRATQ